MRKGKIQIIPLMQGIRCHRLWKSISWQERYGLDLDLQSPEKMDHHYTKQSIISTKIFLVVVQYSQYCCFRAYIEFILDKHNQIQTGNSVNSYILHDRQQYQLFSQDKITKISSQLQCLHLKVSSAKGNVLLHGLAVYLKFSLDLLWLHTRPARKV